MKLFPNDLGPVQVAMVTLTAIATCKAAEWFFVIIGPLLSGVHVNIALPQP